MKTLEQRLAEVRSFLQPGDERDTAGEMRSLSDLLEIASARRDAAYPPAKVEKPTAAPSGNAFAQEQAHLQMLLDAERTGRAGDARLIAALKAETTGLRERCTNLQATLDGYNREAVVAQLTTARDEAVAREQRAQTNISRLEGLCRVRGISRDAAIPVVEDAEHSANCSLANYERRLAEAKTNEEREAVLNDFESAVKRGDLKAKAAF